MNRTVFLLLLLTANVFAGAAEDAYGDVNSSIEFDTDFGFDSNTSRHNFQDDSNTTLGQDAYGYLRATDLNLSNPNSLYRFVKEGAKHYPSMGNANAQSIANKDEFTKSAFGLDQEKLTLDYMKTHADVNTSKVLQGTLQGIQTMEVLRSMFAGRNKIECFMSRRLVTSFYCPMPSRSDSYFIGGDSKTKKEDNKKACDDWCKDAVSCKSKSIAGFSQISELLVGQEFSVASTSLSIDPRGELKGISFHIRITSSDEAKLAYAFEKTILIPFDIEIKRKGNPSYEPYIRDFRISAKEEEAFVYTLPVNSNDIERVRFLPSLPHLNLLHHGIVSLDPSITVTLDKIVTTYADNKLWFCPPTQFVTNSAFCDGMTVSAEVAGSPVLICVPAIRKTGEPDYDAFYTQESCEQQCFEREECLPTYRHLTTAGEQLSPDAFFDVEYGCKDAPGNEACTQQKCAELYNNHTMPYEESIYQRDDTKVFTVQNGQETGLAPRPRYDLSGEMTSNQDPEAKAAVMRNSEKDVAYANMVSDTTFNVSILKVGEVYPAQYNTRYINNKQGLVLEYLPQSDWVRDGKTHYFYIVARMMGGYIDLGVASQGYSGTQPPPDHFMDSNYAIKLPSGSYTLMKINRKEMIWNNSDEAWVSNSAPSPAFLTLPSQSDSPLAYSPDTLAPHTFTKVFDGSRITHDYLIGETISDTLTTQDGMLIRRQEEVNGHYHKRYRGDEGDGKSTLNNYLFYLVSADHRLTYGEIDTAIKSDDPIIYNRADTKQYMSGLGHHGRFDRDKVKMYVQGQPSDMTVYGVYSPDSTEENKKGYIFNFLLEYGGEENE